MPETNPDMNPAPMPDSSPLSEHPSCPILAVPPLKVLLHDLKNPLAHIQSTTELLRLLLSEKYGEASDYEQYLEILDLSTRRAVLLLQRVQLLDQLRQQRVSCKLQAQPLHRIVQETARLYRIWARQRNLRLELELEPIWVRADEGFLTQIVDNLLSNAIKHSQPSGVIRLQVKQSGEQGRLQISDTGPGIPESELATLFEPQVALESAGMPEPPQGLGLAISKQLSGLMQGQIGCHSPQGQGATFYLTLPLAQAPASTPDFSLEHLIA